MQQALNTHEVNLYLRGFLDSPHARLFAKRINELCKEDASVEPAALILMLYPATKCVLACAKETDKIFTALTDPAMRNGSLRDMANAVMATEGAELEVVMSGRQTRLAQADRLVKTIDAAAEKLMVFPGLGSRYTDILCVLKGETLEESSRMSRYIINQHIHSLLQHLAQVLASDTWVQETHASLTRGFTEHGIWERCDAALSLVQAHAQAKWLGSCEGNQAEPHALKSGYFEAMDELSRRVGAFPGTKGMYISRVFESIVEFKTQGYSDETLAARLHISTYTYSIAKKRALAIFDTLFYANLNVLLWLSQSA